MEYYLRLHESGAHNKENCKNDHDTMKKSTSFSSRSNLIYNCCFCENSFRTITNLRRHERLIHNISNCKNEHFKPDNSMYETSFETSKPIDLVKRNNIDENQIKFMRESKQLLSLDDGLVPAVKRLLSIAFIFSPTQKNTPGDGNCFLHAIMDQLR